MIVSADCLHLLTIPSPNVGQRKFMRQLILSGHVLFFVVQAAKMLQQPNPSLPRIRFVLSRAYFAESDEATYFLIMIRVLANEGFDRDGILSIFNDLFVRQRLAHCRDVINVDSFLFDWDHLSSGQCPLALFIGSLVCHKGLAC